MTPSANDKQLELAMIAALAIGAICLVLINIVLAPALLARPSAVPTPATPAAPKTSVPAAAPEPTAPAVASLPDAQRVTPADGAVASATPPDAAAPVAPQTITNPTPTPPLPAVITFRKRAGVWLSPQARQLLDVLAETMATDPALQVQLRANGKDRFGKLRCQAISYYLRRMGISPRRVLLQLGAADPGQVELSWTQ